MSRFVKFGTAVSLIFIAQSASANTTTYEFTAKNNSAATMTVSVDGKANCTADAGKSCTVDFTREGAVLSYSLAGAPPVTFTAGNIETTDVCNIDTNGAHCVDPGGKPTN